MRLTTHRRYSPDHAQPYVLRNRGLRVLVLGRWVLVYVPRRHPLRSL